MPDFICKNCGVKLASRSSHWYHTKKKVCEKDYACKCKYCNQQFKHSSSMYHHMKTCSIKNDSNDDIDITNQNELIKLLKDMQMQINDLKEENSQFRSKKIGNSINNGTIYNGDVNNTVNVNVNVVPFGKEDLSKISKNDLLKVFRSGFNSALQLTETTHFNPKYPEYHNVYISNMKNKYAMTFDGNDWSLVMKDELIDKMYTKKRDYIEDNMDDFINSLLPSQINALHRWLNVDDDHQYVQKVKNEMKLMLYNKRKMALDPKPSQVKVTDLDEVDHSVRVIKEPKHIVKTKIKSARIAPRNGRYRKTVAKRRQ